MSRIELAPEVGEDFDRILDNLDQYLVDKVDNPAAGMHEIVEAIGVLETNPLIGRPAENGKRELMIGRRTHGYVALYRYVAEIDTVFVLGIRAQREAGFGRE